MLIHLFLIPWALVRPELQKKEDRTLPILYILYYKYFFLGIFFFVDTLVLSVPSGLSSPVDGVLP